MSEFFYNKNLIKIYDSHLTTKKKNTSEQKLFATLIQSRFFRFWGTIKY